MGPNVALYETSDGVVHWSYPMAGALMVCGLVVMGGYKPFPKKAPTCIRCIALVQTGKQGDRMPWVPPDPEGRQG